MPPFKEMLDRPGDRAGPASCGCCSVPLHLGANGTAVLERRPMIELLSFISYIITLYIYIIFAGVVMSWLIAFNVVNAHNPFVRSLWQALNALTEPLMRPIRRRLPDLGGLDISPMVLILGCLFIQWVVLPNIAKLVV
jgi:YggT family protein